MEAESVVDLIPQILDLKKILVPIDFSETSKKAFHYALRFAEQFNCEIVLLHVVEPVSPTVGPLLVLEVFLDAEDPLCIVEKKLAALSAQSCSNGTNSASSTVRTGHAPNEITKAAKDLDVDLIVIATHGTRVGGIFASAAQRSAWSARHLVPFSWSAKRSTNLFR